MAYDLFGEQGHQRFSGWAWAYCLAQAMAFGWKPEGTVAPKYFHGEWSGTYEGSDFQTVTDSDARSLGEALERTIMRTSEDALVIPDQTPEAIECSKMMQLVSEPTIADEISLLQRLAKFALKGGFEIT